MVNYKHSFRFVGIFCFWTKVCAHLCLSYSASHERNYNEQSFQAHVFICPLSPTLPGEPSTAFKRTGNLIVIPRTPSEINIKRYEAAYSRLQQQQQQQHCL